MDMHFYVILAHDEYHFHISYLEATVPSPCWLNIISKYKKLFEVIWYSISISKQQMNQTEFYYSSNTIDMINYRSVNKLLYQNAILLKYSRSTLFCRPFEERLRHINHVRAKRHWNVQGHLEYFHLLNLSEQNIK